MVQFSPNTGSFALRTLSLVAVILLAASSAAAPALSPRPPRWEYAELMYRSSSARPAGVGPDGTEVPAVAAAVAIHWISGAGEIEVKGWSDLAEKLKATGFKKEGSPTFQKIQILNFLGEEGWELLEQRNMSTLSMPPNVGGRGPVISSTPNTWLFKRRVMP